MNTRKLQRAFPTVATIRKGGPKKPGVNKRGQAIEVVGDDLKDRFRVVFAPGIDEQIKTDWIKLYQTDQPTRIRAMICFPTVWEAWDCFNEAYNAGRLVARADETHFLVLRDALSGAYTVQNGEPFTPYKPGMKISYEREGRSFELPMRSTGRLRLFLPELGRMVYFELKTTSFYDCQNITNQLAGIQGIADALNRGNAAGVPFYIYRKEQSITWNKPGGGALRVSKWLIQLEVDPAYVGSAIKRMSDFALTGSSAVGALPSGEIAGEVNPEEPEIDEEITDSEWYMLPDAEPEIDPPVDDRTDPVTPEPVGLANTATNEAAAGSPEAAGPAIEAPAGSPLPAGAAQKMTYETACTVKSRTTKELYCKLPTDQLSGRLNHKLKIRPAERDLDTKYEIDAIQAILYQRWTDQQKGK
jgi:hypothetical protein